MSCPECPHCLADRSAKAAVRAAMVSSRPRRTCTDCGVLFMVPPSWPRHRPWMGVECADCHDGKAIGERAWLGRRRLAMLTERYGYGDTAGATFATIATSRGLSTARVRDLIINTENLMCRAADRFLGLEYDRYLPFNARSLDQEGLP